MAESSCSYSMSRGKKKRSEREEPGSVCYSRLIGFQNMLFFWLCLIMKSGVYTLELSQVWGNRRWVNYFGKHTRGFFFYHRVSCQFTQVAQRASFRANHGYYPRLV